MIVVTKVYSKELNTTPQPLPPPDLSRVLHPPKISEWSDLIMPLYTTGHKGGPLAAPILMSFPKLEGPQEDVFVINHVANSFGADQPLLAKPGVTYPIGSYGHAVLLGTNVGMQAAKFLYEHKNMFGASTIVAVHIWDSGAPGHKTPTIAFSMVRYDQDIEDARQENIAAGGNNPQFKDWPNKFLPIFR